MPRPFLLQLSKRICVPCLLPSHTKVSIKQYEKNVAHGMSVSAYNSILIAECSPNLVTAGVQEFPNKTLQMMIDTQDKGICSISELQKRTSGS